MKYVVATFAVALSVFSGFVAAEDFKFDSSEFEKKTFEFTGYLEQKEEALKLRPGSPAYKLAYPGVADRNELLRSTTKLETKAKLNMDPFVADFRVQASYTTDALVNTTNGGTIMEGGLRWSAGPDLTLDLGKRVLLWGKGYAWNPVGFVERPKDANDPQLAREGFVMASGEWTKSYSGPISTVGVTGLIVPTNNSMNGDFGATSRLNPAAKLYALAWNTDIDFMWRGTGAKPQSFGVDFSRNINTALEVHGEWARTLEAPRSTVASSGVTSSQIANYTSYLLGLRYLTENDVTWISEYYRNGSGYGAGDMGSYFQFLDKAFSPNAATTLLNKAQTLSQSAYGRPNPGRDYFYLRASVNEPFGWVYGVAALTVMTNLNDKSYQVTPEIIYTGFSNVEIRGRFIFLGGPSHSEFAEKASSNRLEVYARLYF